MEKLQVRAIFEILGKPAEHIVSSLNLMIDKLAQEPSLKLLTRNVKEPVKVEGSKELFTTFAEVEFEVDSVEKYLAIIFAYMPSNIEIIKPENVSLRNSELSLLGNRIAGKLHEYDSIAKRVMADRQFLVQKLQQHAPQLFNKQGAPANLEQTVKQEEKKTKTKKNSKKKKKK